MTKKSLVIVVLSALCLTTILAGPTNSLVGYYDPWLDINDDGKIDMKDVAAVAKAFGSLGDPINKTALLLALDARIPKKGCISVPAAAFTPKFPDRPLQSGHRLLNLWTMTTQFVAPIQLPSGAAVTNVTCYWSDSSSSKDVIIWLIRYDGQENFFHMSSLFSSGEASYGSSYDDTIDYATVDNQYGYYLLVQLEPYPDHVFYYAVIEYEYPA